MTDTSHLRAFGRRVDARFRWLLSRFNKGVVPFSFGRFVNSQDRPALTARTYYEVQQLQGMLEMIECDRKSTLEIGGGYGRLSPWLADQSTDYVGVEPNGKARRRAAGLLPELEFRDAQAQNLPFDDDAFDLCVSWTVLQHIPPAEIDAALTELQRVTRPGGWVLLAEKTCGESTAVVHPRPVSAYDDLLDACQLRECEQRALEPEQATNCHTMLFQVKER